MTVAQLIDELRKMDPEYRVTTWVDGGVLSVDRVIVSGFMEGEHFRDAVALVADHQATPPDGKPA